MRIQSRNVIKLQHKLNGSRTIRSKKQIGTSDGKIKVKTLPVCFESLVDSVYTSYDKIHSGNYEYINTWWDKYYIHKERKKELETIRFTAW